MAARVNLPGAAGGEPPREPPAPEQKAEVGPKVVPMPADWAQKFNAQGAVRDELGRVLAVRKLRYSERMKVVAILADDGRPFLIGNAWAACSAQAIDGEACDPVINRLHLDALWDRLDAEGVAAINFWMAAQDEKAAADAKN